jgi:hypothetical protein
MTQNGPTEESFLQREQGTLVEQAKRLPGVAEVIEIHQRLSVYTIAITNRLPVAVRNATGGNG